MELVAQNQLVTHPSESQLTKINQYTPAGLAPLAAEEVFVLAGEHGIIAVDNLISESYGVWSIKSLESFSALLPGVPIMLDHDWSSVSKTVGKVFDARLVKYKEAPDWAINRNGNFEYNRKIAAEQGYIAVIVDAYFPINSPIKDMLRLGLLEDVSVGGFEYTHALCPRCELALNRPNDPKDMKKCPIEGDCGISREPGKYENRYYIRDGVFMVDEISLVWAGAAPAASIVTRRKS